MPNIPHISSGSQGPVELQGDELGGGLPGSLPPAIDLIKSAEPLEATLETALMKAVELSEVT